MPKAIKDYLKYLPEEEVATTCETLLKEMGFTVKPPRLITEYQACVAHALLGRSGDKEYMRRLFAHTARQCYELAKDSEINMRETYEAALEQRLDVEPDPKEYEKLREKLRIVKLSIERDKYFYEGKEL